MTEYIHIPASVLERASEAVFAANGSPAAEARLLTQGSRPGMIPMLSCGCISI